MPSPWAHRWAMLLAAAAFLSVFTGTAVTGNEERPYYSLGQTHAWIGAAVALLTIALLIVSRADKRLWRMAWIGLAAVIAQGGVGSQPLPQPAALRIVHAFIGQLFFALAVVMASRTSASWNLKRDPVRCASAFRFVTLCAPGIVLAQVALGTLHRHGALGVGPHLAGAFVAAFLILGLALPVIYNAEHAALHTAAKLFLTIASVQVLLGLTLFSMQSMDIDPGVVILFTIIHAAVGALTLAATVAMALLVRRHTMARS